MTVDTRIVPSRAWTPRIAVQLAVLASAAFVYVTAEMVPVAALPDIAAGLRVSEALVGTLLASYALVAARRADAEGDDHCLVYPVGRTTMITRSALSGGGSVNGPL